MTEAIDQSLDKLLKSLTADELNAEQIRERDALFARIRARGPGDGRRLKEIEAEMYGDGGEPI